MMSEHHGLVHALNWRDQGLMADVHQLVEGRHSRRHARRGPLSRAPER